MGWNLHWSIILAALFLFFGQLSIGLVGRSTRRRAVAGHALNGETIRWSRATKHQPAVVRRRSAPVVDHAQCCYPRWVTRAADR